MTASEARRKVDEGCLPLPVPLLVQPGNALMSVLILNEKVFSQISTSVNVSASRPNEKRRISSSCENDLSHIWKILLHLNTIAFIKIRRTKFLSRNFWHVENPCRHIEDTHQKMLLAASFYVYVHGTHIYIYNLMYYLD